MSHLTDEQLSALRDGALEGAALERARRHLPECAECRDALAELERVDAALSRALAHDPGERYFESFASRVTERIATADRASAAPRRAARGGFLAWLLTPQGLGLAGSAAAVLVVGGLVYFQGGRGTDVRNAKLMDRTQQVVPAPTAPPREDAGAKESEQRLDQPPSPGAGAPAEPPAAQTSEGFAQAPKPEDARALQKRRELDESATANRQPAPSTPTLSSPTPPPAATTSPEAGARTGAASGAMSRVEKTKRGEEVPVQTKKLQGMPSPVVSGSSGPVAIKQEAQPMSGRANDSVLRFQEPTAKSAEEARDRAAQAADAAEMVQLCGRVTDAEGRPVSNAEVAVTDVGRSVTANADGRFCVQSPPGEHTLSVLRVGYEPVRQTITVAGARSDMKLALRAVTVLPSPGSGVTLGLTQEPKSGAAPGVSWTGGWPQPVLQDVALAQSTTELAARTKSAAKYEEAARIWERVLTRLGSPAAQLEARDRIGETRWQSWQLDKTAARAANARTALTSYLAMRPTGDREKLARERLTALGR